MGDEWKTHHASLVTHHVCKNCRMTRAKRVVKICAGRSWRRWRDLFFVRRMCRAPCTRCMILPFLVIRNRFVAIFFVFIFIMRYQSTNAYECYEYNQVLPFLSFTIMVSMYLPMALGSRTTLMDSSDSINRLTTANPNSLRVISRPLNAKVTFT